MREFPVPLNQERDKEYAVITSITYIEAVVFKTNTKSSGTLGIDLDTIPTGAPVTVSGGGSLKWFKESDGTVHAEASLGNPWVIAIEYDTLEYDTLVQDMKLRKHVARKL